MEDFYKTGYLSLEKEGPEMANEKKQNYIRKRYIDNIAAFRDTYEDRKEFLKGLTLPTYRRKTKALLGSSAEAEGGEPTAITTINGISTGQSDYSANGLAASELAKKSLKGKSGLTAAELNAWLEPRTKGKKCAKCGGASHMYNAGEWFIEAEAKAGYRADAIASHSAEESGWGTSKIACDKKNYFGYGAVDSDPYNGAYSWKTHKEGLLGATALISKGYIYRSKNYKGQVDQDSFWLMNNPPGPNGGHRYASNNAWVNNICTIWSNAPSPKNASTKAKTLSIVEDESLESEYETIRHPYQFPDILPIGYTTDNYYHPPVYDRSTYILQMRETESFAMKQDYLPLSSEHFVHLAGPIENFYKREAVEAFMLLRRKIGMEQLVITRGYDLSFNETSHTLGIAIDIYAETPTQALFIADIAYFTGFRSIAIGPKFVHVDIGPAASWGYGDIPIYRGPGTIQVGDFPNGF